MPFVPAVKLGVAKRSAFSAGLSILPNHGPRLKPDRDLAHFLEFGLEPELLELPYRPLRGVGVGVGARLAAAEAVAGVVVPGHHLVVLGAELDDLPDNRVVRALRLRKGLEADDCRRERERAGDEP